MTARELAELDSDVYVVGLAEGAELPENLRDVPSADDDRITPRRF